MGDSNRGMRHARTAKAAALLVLGGTLLGADCHPTGDGDLQVLEPRFFRTSTTSGEDFQHSPGQSTYNATIRAGDHYSKDPRADGTFNLDLWMTLPGLVVTRSIGAADGFRCARQPDATDHIRCTSVDTYLDFARGPHETIVDFKGERIASMEIRELSPPSNELESVRQFHREREWPKLIARFRDRQFGWNDSTLAVPDPHRPDPGARVSDEDNHAPSAPPREAGPWPATAPRPGADVGE